MERKRAGNIAWKVVEKEGAFFWTTVQRREEASAALARLLAAV